MRFHMLPEFRILLEHFDAVSDWALERHTEVRDTLGHANKMLVQKFLLLSRYFLQRAIIVLVNSIFILVDVQFENISVDLILFLARIDLKPKLLLLIHEVWLLLLDFLEKQKLNLLLSDKIDV